MKILYLTMSKIELHKQGIYSDLIHALTEAGHEITLLQVCEDCSAEEEKPSLTGKVRILKVAVGKLFGVNFIKKGINTVKIGPKVKAAVKRQLSNEHFDLVLYATPPITFAGVVRYVKKKCSCRSFLMLKDIFPQNAVDIGLFSAKSPIRAYFRHQEKVLYALSDGIGCMSKGNLEYLLKHDPEIPAEKIIVFPNTQKVCPVKSLQDTEEPGFPERKMRFVFGGNFGRPQAIDFLIRSIGEERMQKLNAQFLFVGNGSETDKVKEAAERLPNMEFLPFMAPDAYERFMEGCDVGLISLDHRFTIPNYPSRVLAYMSMAKPVLAATDPVTDIRGLVTEEAKCGLWCSSDDPDAFISCVEEFVTHPEKLMQYGMNGRKYFEEHFDVNRSVEMIEAFMKG